MPLLTKINNTWVPAVALNSKIDAFKPISDGYVKVNGQWKRFYGGAEISKYYFEIAIATMTSLMSEIYYIYQTDALFASTLDPYESDNIQMQSINITIPTPQEFI